VRIALEWKGLAYTYKGTYRLRYPDVQAVNLLTKEQTSPEFTGTSPNQTVPVLVVDGQPLYQSLAILEWLDETYENGRLLPSDPWAKAQVRALSMIIACDIQPLQNLRVLNAHSSEAAERIALGKRINEEGLESTLTLSSGIHLQNRI
jgi:maleylacetoacetate isomerase